MKVFLTGATGFIGSHVAHELARRGAALRVLTRPSSPMENLSGLSVESVQGDLAEPRAPAPRHRRV